MAGVTAPVPGSTSAPACTATVSILMASLPVGRADHSLVGGAVSGAQHDAVFGLPGQRHARLARQRGGLPVRHVHPERAGRRAARSEEHTSELQSLAYLVCRLLLEKKKTYNASADCYQVVREATRTAPTAARQLSSLPLS